MSSSCISCPVLLTRRWSELPPGIPPMASNNKLVVSNPAPSGQVCGLARETLAKPFQHQCYWSRPSYLSIQNYIPCGSGNTMPRGSGYPPATWVCSKASSHAMTFLNLFFFFFTSMFALWLLTNHCIYVGNSLWWWDQWGFPLVQFYLDCFGFVFFKLQSQRCFSSGGTIPRYNTRNLLSTVQLYLSLGIFSYSETAAYTLCHGLQ